MMDRTKKSEPTIFSSNKEFFKQFKAYKFVYLAFLLISLLLAFLTNTYSFDRFESVSKIKPTRNEAGGLLSNDLFRGLQAFSDEKHIEDEINNLLSFSTILSTINQLNFEVAYYHEAGKLLKKTFELFNDTPFLVTFDKSHVQPINTRFFVRHLSDSTYRLTSSEKEVNLFNYFDRQIAGKIYSFSIDTILPYNEPLQHQNLYLTISLNKDYKVENSRSSDQYYFVFYNDEMLAKSYLENLSVSRMTPPSSILQVRLQGQNMQKIIHFLNSFLVTYFEENLAKKNQTAANTINFIDSQISEVSDSLFVSGSLLRDFRSRNQVMDLGFQGQMVFNQLQKVDDEIIKLRNHERYYNFLLDFFRTNENDFSGIVLPSAMNVDDPLITQQIGELISLSSERANIIASKGESNIFLAEINSKIRVQKQHIAENVRNNLNTMSLTLNELNFRAQRHSAQISNLPRTEINMVNMQRKFDINDELYTFLLQRRSEAAITMASNFPDYEILEPAREITSKKVSPKPMLNFMIALFLGLLFPTVGLVGKNLFNQRIQNTQYIEQFINRSVLGVIFSNKNKTEKVVENYFLHPSSESFRALKSNLLMKMPQKDPKVILITSPQPGDGKSFVSYNLGVSIALAGRKTILLDADLRRPTMHKKFNIENSPGISSILTKNTPINKIIHKTTIENLSFIPAGPVLRMPSKIIEAGILDALIHSLQEEYEYIILDTTPVGMIADALLLFKNATQIIIVARNNHTRKEIFSDVIDKLETNKVLNYDVVFNDLDFKGSPYKVYSKYYSKT
jgi:tyrosine-protein kinase Etk/Wzc